MANEIVDQPPASTAKHTATEHRAGWIFSEINTLAECVERMGILLVAESGGDPRNVETYQVAIKALSAQIGLLADIGAKLTGGLDLHNADPRAWLLPPAYQIDGEEASHG